MHYRNSLKKDPFSAAKHYIQLRLQTLEQAILSKLKYGPEREIMRVTIKQLLNVEPSLEGKINRLLAVMQEIQICGNNYLETIDSQREFNRNRGLQPYISQNKGMYSQQILFVPKVQQNYSNLSQSHKYQNNQLTGRYEPRNKYPREMQAYQPPYIYGSLNNKEQITDNSFSSIHTSKSSKNLTMPNLMNKSDSINQHDLFSFRTQEGASPLKLSKQSLQRKSEDFEQNPYSYLYKQQKSRTKSQKKSSSKSQKSMNSRKNSRTKEQKSLKKSVNYDGKSLNLKVGSFGAKKKLNKDSSKDSIKQINEAQILKKIQTRIKYSKCVVDQIQHSKTSADHFYVKNRFKKESQLRKKLSNQIKDLVNNTSHWR